MPRLIVPSNGSCTAGLVERVPIGRDKTCLYYLTDDGVIALAHAHGVNPAALATGYDLGRRALLARLPALDRSLDQTMAVREHIP